jgi:hypothetical protein
MPDPITSTDSWYSYRLGFCDALERSSVILQPAAIAAWQMTAQRCQCGA